ncbi:MAG: class I SAM-dependent methyltransferase [Candidatus Hodarchaeales archaeon]|jgi:SAM-dependent methyltransferase
MRSEKWDFYLNTLQGHPSLAQTNKDNKGLSFITGYLPVGSRLLAIGCADGMEVKVLKDLGYNVTGITLGQINIDWARKYLPDCDVRLMDLHDLEFDPNTFDCAFSDNCFEHCFAPMIHLLEVWTVLKPEGKFYIKMPKFIDWNEGEKKPGNQLDHHHPNMLPPKMHSEMFKVCGFIIEEQEGNNWLLRKGPINMCHETIQLALLKLNDKAWKINNV